MTTTAQVTADFHPGEAAGADRRGEPQGKQYGWVMAATRGVLRNGGAWAVALVLFLAVTIVPGLLASALQLVGDQSGGWLLRAISVAVNALAVLQVAATIVLFCGLLRMALAGGRRGGRPPLTVVLTCGREVWWYLACAVVTGALVWESRAWEAASGATWATTISTASTLGGVIVLVALLAAIPMLAVFTLVAPVAVVRRRRVLAALAESFSLARRRGRLWQIVPGMVLMLLTLAAFALPVTLPRVSAGNFFLDQWPASVPRFLLSEFSWSAGLLIGLATWLLCLITAYAAAALYRSVAGRPTAAASIADGARAKPHHRRLVAACAVAVAAFGLALALAWALGLGYSNRDLRPGERVSLRSGITLTAPGKPAVSLVTYRGARWLPFGENHRGAIYLDVKGIDGADRLVSGRSDSAGIQEGPGMPAGVVGAWGESFFTEDAFVLKRAEANPTLAENSDHSVSIHLWDTHVVQVVTRIPGKQPGVVTIWEKGEAKGHLATVARRVWRLLGIEGAQLPESFKD